MKFARVARIVKQSLSYYRAGTEAQETEAKEDQPVVRSINAARGPACVRRSTKSEKQVITSNIEPILIVTGTLTATMLAQFVAPSWMLRHTFGEAPSGAVGILVARHWGLLLFCVGMLLVYSAFHPAVREPAVVLASVEKVGFVACVFGTSLRKRSIASIMAAGDAVMVLVFVLYLAGL